MHQAQRRGAAPPAPGAALARPVDTPRGRAMLEARRRFTPSARALTDFPSSVRAFHSLFPRGTFTSCYNYRVSAKTLCLEAASVVERRLDVRVQAEVGSLDRLEVEVILPLSKSKKKSKLEPPRPAIPRPPKVGTRRRKGRRATMGFDPPQLPGQRRRR